MHWASWSDFWHMAGYGLYVWGSFGVTLIAIIIEVFLLNRGGTNSRRRLKRMQQFEEQ